MPHRFTIGPCALDAELNTVRRDGRVIRLEPKVMEVCVCLAEHAGEVVRKEDLIRAVWHDTFVTDDVLIHAISELRKVFEDDPKHPRFIETIPKRGYRLIAGVERDRDVVPTPAVAAVGVALPSAAAPARPSRRAAFLWAAGILILLAFAASIALRPRVQPKAPPAHDVKLNPVPIVTYADGTQWLPAFSPDGTRVAYSWSGQNQWSLEVKELGSDARLRLTKHGSSTPPGPTWSPDGTQIAFVRMGEFEERGIFVISALGGSERKLRSLAPWRFPQRMISWSPDGRWMAFSDAAGNVETGKPGKGGPNAIYVLSMETLEARQLTFPASDDLGDAAPTFSPDGKTIAFVHTTPESHDIVCTVPFAGGPVRQLVTYGKWTNGITWTADSEWLVFDRSIEGGFALWRVSLAGGEPQRLDLPSNRTNTLEPTIWHDRLAYEAHESQNTVGRIPLNGSFSDVPQMPIASTRNDRCGRYSPAGNKIAFISDRTGKDELWIADADGGNPLQLTHIGAPISDLAWAPDGGALAVSTMSGKIFLVSMEGGNTRTIFEEAIFLEEQNALAFSHDGRFVYVISQPGHLQQLLKVPVAGGPPVKVLDELVSNVEESPDGNMLFYSRPHSNMVHGAEGIWRRPVEGGAEQFVVAFSGTWSVGPDGLYLSKGTKIDRYSYSGKRLNTVARIGKFWMFDPLSIAPDGRSAIFCHRLHDSVEIEMVPGFK